jgi:CTP:molybdopterin cytidylyltransferase MocA
MGFPKALLDFHGETFLDHLIRIFAAECAPIVAVLGAGASRIRAKLRAPDRALLVVNPDYPLGQLTSMQCGLRAVPPGCSGVLFTLVDHPNVSPATLRRLLDSPALVTIPRYQGKRGHPIYFAHALIAEFLAVDPRQSARVVLERHAADIRYVDVEDPGILEDVDDPEAYRRLTGAHVAKS